MEIFFQDILIWIETSKYFLLFLGCIISAPIVIVASGFLYSIGQFNFLPMFFIILFTVLLVDTGWYSLGRFGTRSIILKYGHWVGIDESKLNNIENYFKIYQQKIIFISKLTSGLGITIFVLIIAGIFKVPFKNYITAVFLGGFISTIILLIIGYFFGNIFEIMPTSIKLEFIILILIIITLAIKYTNKYIQKKEYK